MSNDRETAVVKATSLGGAEDGREDEGEDASTAVGQGPQAWGGRREFVAAVGESLKAGAVDTGKPEDAVGQHQVALCDREELESLTSSSSSSSSSSHGIQHVPQARLQTPSARRQGGVMVVTAVDF